MAGKEAETPEISQNQGTPGKDLVNKDGSVTKLIEWATQNVGTIEDLVDLFDEYDVPVSRGEEITGDYVLVNSEEKPEWCAKHEGTMLGVVVWNFYESSTGEFAAMHIVSQAGKFILNDGAQGGMYGQLRKITDERERVNPESAVRRTSTAGLIVRGGLRRNKPFYYNTDTKKAIPRLELDDTVKHPMNKRELAKPTWSFNL